MLRALFRIFLKRLFRVQIRGDLGQFKRPKLLIVANHESFLDGFILGVFLPVKPVFVVHSEIVQRSYFRLALRFVPHIAVDPTRSVATKTIVKLIEQGRPVMIFPEGRITRTGALMKIYEGPAFIAAKTGADIIPVHLDGLKRSYFSRMTQGYGRRLFPRVRITVLPVTRLPLETQGSAKQRRRKAAIAMRKLMENMLFISQPHDTLFTALVNAVRTHGRRTQLVEDVRGTMTYGEILKTTLALGRWVSRAAPQGAIVGILLPNVATTLCLLFGMSSVRRTPAMLNYTAGAEGLKNACGAALIKTIVTSRKFIEQGDLSSTISALEGVTVLYLEDIKQQFRWADKLWLMAFAVWFPRAATLQSRSEDPGVVLFTSGSEGRPKGVVLSHHALLANVGQIKAVIDFTPSDKFLIALPLFHALGLTCGGILTFITGSKLVLYVSPLHYRVIPELSYDKNCTVIFGTSTFLANYAKFAHPYDFYTIRYAVAGAEKLSDDVRQLWMEKFGIRILEGYGATECAPVVSVNTPHAYKSGTVGNVLPAIETRIEPVPGIDEGGLLHVRGPNLMSGYLMHDNPGVLQPPHSSFGSGWHNMGDIARIDAEGFVSLCGRIKRFAKVAGEMVPLDLTERLAREVSPEAMHAASIQADPKRGESIVLFTTDPALSRDALIQRARVAGVSEIAVARKFVVLPEIPILPSGKVDYAILKQRSELAQ